MPHDLDDIDHSVSCAELQRDGRQSHQDLSARIGLSPTPCARRIRRLETDGFITGYSARIDEAKLGFLFNVFVSVQLDKQVDDRAGALRSAPSRSFRKWWIAG